MAAFLDGGNWVLSLESKYSIEEIDFPFSTGFATEDHFRVLGFETHYLRKNPNFHLTNHKLTLK